MWDNATIMMLVEGTFVTLYMTLVSTFMGYVLGLPMGIALVITAPKGLRPNKIIYKILDVIVNIVRSIPFLILLIKCPANAASALFSPRILHLNL